MCFRNSLILMMLVLCCADLVFREMPFGFGKDPWDELLSDEDVEQFFQQVAVVNRARHHTIVLSSH